MIAPGAENVGQARIVTELGKAFAVEGLFGMVDQGAFGGGSTHDGGEDMAMAAVGQGMDTMMIEDA